MATGKNGKVALPKGFTAITGGGNSWDFKKQKTLQGVLKKIEGPFKSKQYKDKEFRVARIETKDGEVSVFERAGTRALFDLKKGSKVFIGYVGKKKIPGRKEPMEEFIVATA